MSKICNRCKIEKDVSEFYGNPANLDGLDYKCKKCAGIYSKKYYLENKDDKKKYRENNREKRRVYSKKYRENNREKTFAHHKVAEAVKRGELVRPTSCSKCNKDGKIHGHHNNYNEPLEVIWLCQNCHQELHLK